MYNNVFQFGDHIMARKARNYIGTELTTRHFSNILENVLKEIRKVHGDRPDLVIAAWPEVIGGKLAAMTAATAFIEGILYVNVRNSTLLSLLSKSEKPLVLSKLRQKFPQLEIKTIIFRMG